MTVVRFIRCVHCRLPHDATATVCPNTGKAIESSQPPPPKASETDELIGKAVIGRYEIESLLGEGGLARVYRGKDTRLDRPVAVKVMHGALLSSEALVQRFVREARVSAAVRHPNVVEVYDFGSMPTGSPFLVMELLEGQTLARRIGAQGALPIGDALDAAGEMLAGLERAHELGVIHRDVKPENIMLLERPRMLKLLDFGISYVLSSLSGEPITRTGEIVGTPAYLSPEQAQGAPVDARADVWAASVVLYEMLTGHPPFRSPIMPRLLLAIMNEEPKPPSALRGDVPPVIEEVVLKGLRKNAADRWPSAAAMRSALERARTSEDSGEDDTLRMEPSDEDVE